MTAFKSAGSRSCRCAVRLIIPSYGFAPRGAVPLGAAALDDGDDGALSTLFASCCSAFVKVCSIDFSCRESCAMSFERLSSGDASCAAGGAGTLSAGVPCGSSHAELGVAGTGGHGRMAMGRVRRGCSGMPVTSLGAMFISPDLLAAALSRDTGGSSRGAAQFDGDRRKHSYRVFTHAGTVEDQIFDRVAQRDACVQPCVVSAFVRAQCEQVVGVLKRRKRVTDDLGIGPVLGGHDIAHGAAETAQDVD